MTLEELVIAADLVGYSIRELCMDDPLGRMRSTELLQPALFVSSVLTLMAHRRETISRLPRRA
jgi:trans-AT polyketide synthase/acyltransferase/oxidoreductase domain-containing protein